MAVHTDPGHVSRCGWRGRSREWEVLADLLHAAEHGRGGVLLVDGESGMGKTRLLAQAADAAAARGFTIWRGGADETGRLTPLAPLMTAFGESAQVPTSAWTADPGATDQRLRLVRKLQARLEERAVRGPQLMALDDLHWADSTTLLALRTLIPELSSYPLVWILSRTKGGGSAAVERLYEGLARDGAIRMTLEALDDQAVAEIVTDVLGATPEPDLLALAAGAGGNPFILTELLGGLCDEDAIEIGDGRAHLVSQRLPHRMRAIAHHRLSRLSPPSWHILQVAAVLGRSFRVKDLADMLSERPSGLLAPMAEAEASGVVVPAGDMLVFRHDLLWRAVIETIPESMRQALHGQAAEMLLDRGGSAILAASHLMDSASPGDRSALSGLDRAAREVLPSSPPTAADLAIRALELTAPADPARFERAVTAVYALTNAGRLTEAIELARTALMRATLPAQAAQLRYELANTLLLAGHAGDSVVEAEKALDGQCLRDELRGLAEQVMFRGMFATHDRRGRERAEAVVSAGGRHSAPARVGAHMLLTTLTWAEGRAAEAIDHIREATRIAAYGPIEAQHSHPRLHLISLLTDTRQIAEAERILQAAEEEISDLTHITFTAVPALLRARLRLAQARLDDAATEAQAGLSIADKVGMHAFDLLGLAVLAIVAVQRGDLDAAATHIERYESLYQEGQGSTYGMGWAAWAMTLVTEARAGPIPTISAFRGHFDDDTKQRWLLMTEPNAAAWLTRAALAAGDRSAAETFTTVAEGLHRGNPTFPVYSASAVHARGILDGDPAALAEASATHLDPWSSASASEDLGVLHARRSGGTDPAAAIQGLDQALEGYQRIGATRDAARVRARLRELGVRRRHWKQSERPLTGWAGLTDTERDIAVLVAQGLTNPQVAAQMFISRHTVKFHLGQVFRKLHISSRVELAGVAAEHTGDTRSNRPER
jgi:ATP/maltotriose-dependent transcriptional regulator MalT